MYSFQSFLDSTYTLLWFSSIDTDVYSFFRISWITSFIHQIRLPNQVIRDRNLLLNPPDHISWRILVKPLRFFDSHTSTCSLCIYEKKRLPVDGDLSHTPLHEKYLSEVHSHLEEVTTPLVKFLSELVYVNTVFFERILGASHDDRIL